VLHHQVVSAPLRLVRSPTHPSGAAVEASGFVVGLESERCVESIPHLPSECPPLSHRRSASRHAMTNCFPFALYGSQLNWLLLPCGLSCGCSRTLETNPQWSSPRSGLDRKRGILITVHSMHDLGPAPPRAFACHRHAPTQAQLRRRAWTTPCFILFEPAAHAHTLGLLGVVVQHCGSMWQPPP
jgi:hypothetical protein